ncbi:hypothetical protein SAMN02745136_00093 [Anaerocolumna jejuensis DSM 15929]|uniref:Uncharacterized protein n=1 Tax=Anaerocolumna jejuensis DSM 15929 TaxID=1121322 RepID=A0A1M6JII5_9FIRM|nr:hypothetical protein [Anaerocolumna jejuensis]SHJ46463.1 hypothetical protein SAMN02745136_00093 [Anaerocolumna jejuensis DSM 15929]
MLFLASTSGMANALSNITSAVASVVSIATTGDLAIFFWAGVAGIGIGIMHKLKH